MNATHQNKIQRRLQSQPDQFSPGRNRGTKSRKPLSDPNQAEFVGIIWQPSQHPYRLRAGDVIRYDSHLCRVIRVSECAAVVLMNRPTRDFKTRFDKPVRFTPPPATFRISPNSETEIINIKKYDHR
jgi:hypothetical protein